MAAFFSTETASSITLSCFKSTCVVVKARLISHCSLVLIFCSRESSQRLSRLSVDENGKWSVDENGKCLIFFEMGMGHK